MMPEFGARAGEAGPGGRVSRPEKLALPVLLGAFGSFGLFAGTFAVLATLPITILLELGTVVAFGVLVDTFIVRSMLVPAIVTVLGDRSWWPSRLARRREPEHAAASPQQL